MELLTANQLLAMLTDSAVLINLLAMYGGLVVHVVKKSIFDKVSVIQYVKDHALWVTATLGGLATIFLGLQATSDPESGGQLSIAFYALLGYSGDSFAGKYSRSAQLEAELDKRLRSDYDR